MYFVCNHIRTPDEGPDSSAAHTGACGPQDTTGHRVLGVCLSSKPGGDRIEVWAGKDRIERGSGSQHHLLGGRGARHQVAGRKGSPQDGIDNDGEEN